MSQDRRSFLKHTVIAGAWASLGLRPTEAFGSGRTLLILGGTQFLGPALVEAARAAGFTLTLFTRGKTNPHLFPDVERLTGDRNGKLDALRGRRWDAVVDTSGYVPRQVRESATLLAGSVQHYVFISTISVYADTSKPGTNETAPVGKLQDESVETIDGETYGPLKALCEQAAEKALPGRVTIIRPGLIVGPGDPSDRFTYWPVRVARGGERPPGTRPGVRDETPTHPGQVSSVAHNYHTGCYLVGRPGTSKTYTVMEARATGSPKHLQERPHVTPGPLLHHRGTPRSRHRPG